MGYNVRKGRDLTMNILGDSIKTIRKSKKLTQKQLAELTGFKQNTISNHENGKRQLDEKDIRIYAEALEIQPQELFDLSSGLNQISNPSTKDTPLPSSVSKLNTELNTENHAQWVNYGNELLEEQNLVQEESTFYRPSPQRDERFTTLTDQYRRLNPSRQETIRDKVQEEIKEQNIVRLEDIRKRNDILSHSDSSEVEEIGLYGEVSAGTGLWLSDETIETILYPKPIPTHDIALRVKGNSMEPLFQDGEVVFVRKTQSVNSGQIIIIIVNNEAYIKKLYKRHDEVRLISLNSDYDDIVLTEYDQIEVVGIVVL